VIAHFKHNLSEKGASIGYKIIDGDEGKPIFSWLGGREVTAEMLLADSTPNTKVKTKREAVRATITREMAKREIQAGNPTVSERTLERYLKADVMDGFLVQPKQGYYAPKISSDNQDSAAATFGGGTETRNGGIEITDANSESNTPNESEPAPIAITKRHYNSEPCFDKNCQLQHLSELEFWRARTLNNNARFKAASQVSSLLIMPRRWEDEELPLYGCSVAEQFCVTDLDH
jgi:hypothetical protein